MCIHCDKKNLSKATDILDFLTTDDFEKGLVEGSRTKSYETDPPPDTIYLNMNRLLRRIPSRIKKIARVYRTWEKRLFENLRNTEGRGIFAFRKADLGLDVWTQDVLVGVTDPSEMSDVLIGITDEELLITAKEIERILFKLKSFVIAGENRPPTAVIEALNAYEFNLAESTAVQVDRSLKDVVSNGIASGKSTDDISRDIRAKFKTLKKSKATVIARTETIRASSEGAKTTYINAGLDTVAVLPALTACPICMAKASENPYKVDDASAYAPFHPNCVTGDTEIVAAKVTKMMRFRYDGSIYRIKFADGRLLAVTENHMILTSRGFVTANRLQNMDDVVDCSLLDGVIPQRPDMNNGPATAEQIFSALSKSSQCTTASMPSSTEYFHGDGKFNTGEIDIISADGFLGDNFKSSKLNKSFNLSLNARGLDGYHSGVGNLNSMLIALSSASDGIMGGLGISDIFFSTPTAHHKSGSLSRSSNYDARFKKASSDNCPGDIEPLREFVLGNPRFVKFNKIVSIDVEPFHDYVYDLETMATSYVSNGVISSNCRCTIVPVFDDSDVEAISSGVVDQSSFGV